MKQVIISKGEKYFKSTYKKEEELGTVFSNSFKKIISENSVWIAVEKQFKAKNFKNFKHSIADGFLLVWDNPTTPVLYISEIELENHSIDKHILPQVGDFISFIQSATTDELNSVRNYLYQFIKDNNAIFQKIQKDTGKEVYELLDNAMEDLQILLVIDTFKPELSIGLSQIEKAINVKIRKIEVNKFIDEKDNEIILFSDSDVEDIEKNGLPDLEEYSIDYHLERKPDKIINIIKDIEKYAHSEGLKVTPTKYYIGFHKKDIMLFSCVVRFSTVVFYSKAKIGDIKGYDELQFRDVRKIGHYTNHLPTEIVIREISQMELFKSYIKELKKKFDA